MLCVYDLPGTSGNVLQNRCVSITVTWRDRHMCISLFFSHIYGTGEFRSFINKIANSAKQATSREVGGLSLLDYVSVHRVRGKEPRYNECIPCFVKIFREHERRSYDYSVFVHCKKRKASYLSRKPLKSHVTAYQARGIIYRNSLVQIAGAVLLPLYHCLPLDLCESAFIL
jgi:hypothetical protein